MKQYGIRLFMVVNAALVMLLAWQWMGFDGKLRNLAWQSPEPIAPDLGSEAAALPDARAMDVGLFVATLDRPLFSPSRRPAPPPSKEVDAKEAPDPLANIHLYGLYATDDGPSGMLARVEGKVRRIAVNETLGGWTLKSVQEREATLSRNGEERVIPLTTVRPSAPAKQATAGQPAAAAAPGVAPGGGSAAGAAEERRQQMEEARRELQRRRNELRARAGAKPVNQ